MRGLLAAMLFLSWSTPAAADQKMLFWKDVQRVFEGTTFTSIAANGAKGTITFGLDGHVTFTGAADNPRKSDIGSYRFSETGYCSRWTSTNKTVCFTVSLVKDLVYQLWTVNGAKVDRLILEQRAQ